MTNSFEVNAIGTVESSLIDIDDAPRQADEGAPSAWLVFDPLVRDALSGLATGEEIVVITWLDRADRDVLAVHPRGDRSRPMTGVFLTRSPDRPNPIGLHQTRVIAVDGLRVQVAHLEAVHGTPVIDVKVALSERIDRR
jgi:tRNA-Thr(GGU) m(6)t(6)A37 methyltransferase TsaA